MKKSLLTILMIPSMMLAVPMVSSARTGAEEMIDLDVQEISLSYSGGVMHITGANNQIVTIYNLAGVAVKSFRVEGQDKRFNLSLSDGVYIIKVGTSFTRKILVRR
nr:T9SS type A sorting domain-containing protein [uncultured Prevotella sp.]